jgi:hypothetical protein
MVYQLIGFHINLLYNNQTTYDFIVSEQKRQRDQAAAAAAAKRNNSATRTADAPAKKQVVGASGHATYTAPKRDEEMGADDGNDDDDDDDDGVGGGDYDNDNDNNNNNDSEKVDVEVGDVDCSSNEAAKELELTRVHQNLSSL